MVEGKKAKHGEFENEYQNKVEGITSGLRHCMKTRSEVGQRYLLVLISFSDSAIHVFLVLFLSSALVQNFKHLFQTIHGHLWDTLEKLPKHH